MITNLFNSEFWSIGRPIQKAIRKHRPNKNQDLISKAKKACTQYLKQMEDHQSKHKLELKESTDGSEVLNVVPNTPIHEFKASNR